MATNNWLAEYHERTEQFETARAREIAALTEQRAFEIIRSLVPFAEIPANPENGMGMVEQQAIFRRAYSK